MGNSVRKNVDSGGQATFEDIMINNYPDFMKITNHFQTT